MLTATESALIRRGQGVIQSVESGERMTIISNFSDGETEKTFTVARTNRQKQP